MNLNFPLLDTSIRLEDSTILVLEHPEVFSRIARQFYNYQENSELKLFDNSYSSMKESHLLVLTDMLGYSLNSSNVLKLIYSDLENQFNEQPVEKSEVERLLIEINKLITTQLLDHELHLESQEPTLMELFKSFSIKIETTSQTVFEKCIEFVHIFKYLKNKKLLVWINVCSYLTEEEVSILLEEIKLKKVSVLFIEPTKVYQVPQLIIDSDFCLIS